MVSRPEIGHGALVSCARCGHPPAAHDPHLGCLANRGDCTCNRYDVNPDYRELRGGVLAVAALEAYAASRPACVLRLGGLCGYHAARPRDIAAGCGTGSRRLREGGAR